MKRFSQYTDAELLVITNEELNDAIRREAIGREMKIPVPLTTALRSSEWVGYQKPAECAEVFEIQITGRYSSPHRTGLGYLNKERAMAALEGAVRVENEGYGATAKDVIVSGTPTIVSVFIGESPSQSKGCKFTEYGQDDTAFDKLVDECMEKYSTVRQADYDAKVRRERSAEYLRLAGGNEEIAKAFWAKAERTEWPSNAIAAA